MSRRLWVFLALAGTALLVSGAAVAGKRYVVGQKYRTFTQAEITIQPGETVVFRNDDDVTHNVFSRTPGNSFNLKTQKPGAQTPVTFYNEGTAEVRCAIHPRMKLLVRIKR
jgi:plastocyanin